VVEERGNSKDGIFWAKRFDFIRLTLSDLKPRNWDA
jgi:hypothetical protein